MKITKIEIKNFKAFRGEPYVFDLSQKGLNLLLYGENGSGKTSLYKALEYFFESSEGDFRTFATYQNRFDKDDGYVRLHFTSDTNLPEEYYEWSENPQNDTKVQPIIDTSRTKGFLDYKELLKTNYLHASEQNVDVFDLLVNTILKNIINLQSTQPRSFAEQWQDISEIIFPEQETEQVVEIPLNEAKLSAIALSIFFAGFKLQPSSDLRLIVLDDVLIGLDMSHRLSLLNILEEIFNSLKEKEQIKYQIILMTYDRTCYEMVKKLKSEDENWKAAELYCGKVDGYEIPVYVEDRTYLEKAREYLETNDYKACAVYTRSAFEAIIKGYCEKDNIAIKYREDVNELNSNDFWSIIKDKKIILPDRKNKKRIIKLALVKKIETARKFILNPLSHANIVNITKKDLEDAIEAVEWLEDALEKHLKTTI